MHVPYVCEIKERENPKNVISPVSIKYPKQPNIGTCAVESSVPELHHVVWNGAEK